MNEITCVFTVEITAVLKNVTDENTERFLEEHKKDEKIRQFEKVLKKDIGADNVLVTGVKAFVREQKEDNVQHENSN